MSKKAESIFDQNLAESSLWILIPKVAGSTSITTILILFIFWIDFGEIPHFAIGFAIVLAVFQILMVIGIRFRNRTDLHVTKTVKNDWLDKLGAIWLMACAFGALAGWICNQLANGFPDLSLIFQILSILFAIFLPFITMLPNLRYLETKVLYIQIPILFLVTTLPMFVGLTQLRALFKRFFW